MAYRNNNRKMFDKNLNMFNSPSCLGYKRFENIICNLNIISNTFLIEESQKNAFGIIIIFACRNCTYLIYYYYFCNAQKK